jgi:hypothetical protein
MITIPKTHVAQWLLTDYMASLHTVNEKLRWFERKYGQSWETFAQVVTAGEQGGAPESFTQWDDYIEWRAYTQMAQELTGKIDEVKHGNFEIA